MKQLIERAQARMERAVTGTMTHEDWVALDVYLRESFLASVGRSKSESQLHKELDEANAELASWRSGRTRANDGSYSAWAASGGASQLRRELDETKAQLELWRTGRIRANGEGTAPPPGANSGADAALVAQLRQELAGARSELSRVSKELTDAKAEAASWRNRANDTGQARYEAGFAAGQSARGDQQSELNLTLIRRLMRLCHPDKHANSPASNEVTRWLIAMRERLNGHSQ
jgi:hypothetical protein